MQDATDGAKQTILVLQVGWDRAVPWTKPADLKFNPAAPLEALGTIRPDKIGPHPRRSLPQGVAHKPTDHGEDKRVRPVHRAGA